MFLAHSNPSSSKEKHPLAVTETLQWNTAASLLDQPALGISAILQNLPLLTPGISPSPEPYPTIEHQTQAAHRENPCHSKAQRRYLGKHRQNVEDQSLKTPPTTCVGEDVGKKEPSYTAGGNIN
jgi:hypothetical protein